jgi:hypothetical protein
MFLSTQLTHCNLHVRLAVLGALFNLLPVNGIAAPQVNNSSGHAPKPLNYSKMTTQQLVNEGEKIIFGGSW